MLLLCFMLKIFGFTNGQLDFNSNNHEHWRGYLPVRNTLSSTPNYGNLSWISIYHRKNHREEDAVSRKEDFEMVGIPYYVLVPHPAIQKRQLYVGNDSSAKIQPIQVMKYFSKLIRHLLFRKSFLKM